jgi:hypothetical protein
MFCSARDQLPAAGRVDVLKQDFDSYVDLFNRSRLLVNALKKVLNDPEHTLFMEEAMQIYPVMPDLNAFANAVTIFDNYLNDIDLRDRTYRYQGNLKGGVRINIPVETARKLNHLVYLNCQMIGTIFSGWFDTDYGKHFTYMKRHGAMYTGPNAFRETMAVRSWLLHMKKESAELGSDAAHFKTGGQVYEPV